MRGSLIPFLVTQFLTSLREWDVDKQCVVRSVQDTTSSGWAYGGNWSVSYDPTGDHVLCTEPQSQSLR